jgi:hypothetical protein
VDTETLSVDMDDMPQSCSQLSPLNLAHTKFSSVPVSLACIAVDRKFCSATITCFAGIDRNLPKTPASQGETHQSLVTRGF